MRISARVTHQPKGQDWPSLTMVYTQSWQSGFKETQRIMNQKLAQGSTIVKIEIEEEK